ncbi:putative arginine decarboxylase [Helianthus annuus]|nr:putative arginine decarboxylase [Helianthus annuus]KAJ0607151.1 putative arginine decarboxylase [Helianthus annuus]KAJ0767205.1 putative arginine decarboxylase [Helianthus annuus]KAJ0942643.1 putative arginine decarboxylase [Helianthus annuus]
MKFFFPSTIAFACPNLRVRCNGQPRASCSQERNHGIRWNKDVKAELEDKKRHADDNMFIPDSKESPPLVSRLKAVAARNDAYFQFPSHNQGRAAPSSLSSVIGVQPFIYDFTTFPAVDNLFAPKGPILDAQKEAAKLFGAKETWFLVGGTTCGIQASILATCSPGDTLIIQRHAHKSAFSGLVLSGVIPKYINTEFDFDWDIPYGITPSQVEKAMKELDSEGRKASAVLIASPTYNGICSNLEDISDLCHSRDIPLIVDEAHGAHLRFHRSSSHLLALHQGADISIQSTHKVLGSLTQSSMLHLSGKIVDRERICQCLQTLQTTSPSYLLLASLDAARAQISEHPQSIFNKPFELAREAKALVERIPGITIFNSSTLEADPLRLTVGVWKLGLSGFEANEIITKDYGLISEVTGTRSILFVVNLGTSKDDIVRLVSGLKHLSETHISIQVGDIHPLTETNPSMRLSPRDAFFASKKKVRFEESIGEVCGELICPFPPGIPLLVPGEVITEEVLSYLLKLKNKGGFVIGVADSTLSSIVACGNPIVDFGGEL